jgi:isopenicillin-N epimerase
MRELFQLEPDIHFLNHGSFGATPRAVHRSANRLRRRMEKQPVRFLAREIYQRLDDAMAVLSDYLGAPAHDTAFVPNATYGVNVVANSLADLLKPGDEILATDIEYGACSNAWERVCQRTGAIYVRRSVPLPDEPGGASPEEVAAHFLSGITPRTRVIFLSHITSPTALRLPIEAIIAHARERGILTLIDGAHAPGQLPLNLSDLGADFYSGNCHKWLCAPKGSGFLYVRPEQQHLMQPLVVSWGWGPERHDFTGCDLHDLLHWTGTTDFSAWLATPAAIQFQREHDWEAVRGRCSALLDEWLPRLADAVGMTPVYAPGSPLRPPQLAITPVPAGLDPARLKTELYDRFRVEAPVTFCRERVFVRVSVQAYNDAADLAALEAALRECSRTL